MRYRLACIIAVASLSLGSMTAFAQEVEAPEIETQEFETSEAEVSEAETSEEEVSETETQEVSEEGSAFRVPAQWTLLTSGHGQSGTLVWDLYNMIGDPDDTDPEHLALVLSGTGNITYDDWWNNIAPYRASNCKKMIFNGNFGSIEMIGDGRFTCSEVEFYGTVELLGGEGVPQKAISSANPIESITMPGVVKKLGPGALSYCDTLRTITLSNGMLEIGDGAFMADNGLTSMVIPQSVSKVGNSMFSSCRNLRTVTLSPAPNWQGALYDTSIVSVTIPVGVKNLTEAFAYCPNLTSVTIPAGVELLKDAFRGCSALTSVTLPEGIKDCEGAFNGCSSLTTVVIPANTEGNLTRTFEGCTNLRKVVIQSSRISSLGDDCFKGCSNILRAGPIGSGCELEYAPGNEIPEAYFRASSPYLNNIVVPSGVTKVGIMAFSQLPALKKVTLPDSVITLESSACASDPALEEVILSDGIQDIDAGTFSGCTSLSKVKMPKYLKHIKYVAFEDCTSLHEIVIPLTVQKMHTTSFLGCNNITLRGARNSWAEWYCAQSSVLEKVPTIRFQVDESMGEGCTVWFHANGGYIPFDPESLEEKNVVYFRFCEQNAPLKGYASYLTPVREGYTFTGWYTEQEGGVPVNDQTICPKAYSCTYYAHWTKGDMPFSDVPAGSYYFEPVLWAYKNGITTGVSATKFGSADTCTRGQMVTFLWRANGCPQVTQTSCKFVDVKPGAYYYTPVLWAIEKGITTGTSETTFSPEAKVERGQTVTFLWRAFGSPNISTSKKFADVSPSAYYAKAVDWAVEKNITTGTSPTTFAPKNNCLRAQIVTFLYRAYAQGK